jgi:C-terminal processing protease CtpA/Prc
MVTDLNGNELQQFLGDLVAMERQLDGYIGRQLQEVAWHPKVAEAIKRFHQMVRSQREALEARRQTVGGKQAASPTRIAPVPFPEDTRHEENDKVASAALHTLYTAFNHAAFGYAMLHAVAHRYFDSQAEGNTADLAEAHLRAYAAAAQEINQIVSDVIVRELSQRDHACRCQCPSCALGVCLCAPHGTNTVNQAWRETSPSAPSGGIWVRPPRSNSVAARAGLRDGDRVIAVDDQEIASDLDVGSMQTAIRKHQSGEEIRLQVRRATGELQEVTVTRP